MRRLGVTLRLVLVATIVGVLIAMAVGMYLGREAIFDLRLRVDRSSRSFSSRCPSSGWPRCCKDVGIRINKALGQRVLLHGGGGDPEPRGRSDRGLDDRLGHLVLPSLTLILISVVAAGAATSVRRCST